jgi:putative tryptophan/tyrosine transport system substrate-binding protein
MQFVRLKRRQFFSLLGGAAATWPFAVGAQPLERPRRIGWLMGFSEQEPEVQRRNAVLVAALRELGWIVGRNLQIDYRYLAGGGGEHFDMQAAELIALAPDVLLANNTPATQALLRTTRTVPIIFALLLDPVASGLVTNMARPGGNITGFTNFEPSMGGKWLGLLKDLSPGTSKIALIFNPRTAPYLGIMQSIEAAASAHAIDISRRGVADTTELESALAAAGREGGTALLVFPDVFTAVNRQQIVALAAQHRLPAVYPYRYFTTAGGLMSYSADVLDTLRRTAGYLDRVLRGEKAGNLPVQAPIKFELTINLKTAKQLGLTVPLTLQATADEVIE